MYDLKVAFDFSYLLDYWTLNFNESAQGLRTGTHRNLNQQVKLIQKMLQLQMEYILYITKQGIKRFVLFLAWTVNFS